MASLRPPSAQQKVDTSLLLADLMARYRVAGAPICVDFRILASYAKLGDQYTHQVHPYPGKLLASIAGFFLRASTLTPRPGLVLDPFCGSGTVALETSLVGLQPMVADVNPMAHLITRVKTTPYDPLALLHEVTKIARVARRLKSAPEIPLVNGHIWYSPKRKSSLERLLRAIHRCSQPSSLDFFLLCFSVAARRLSNADPAVSVPVRMREKESLPDETNKEIRRRKRWLSSADPISEFERVCLDNIERVHWANTAAPMRIPAISAGMDARDLRHVTGAKLESNTVPMIITSPPYGSAQKYIRATGLSLNWLGLAGPCGLKELERRSIGREHVPKNARDETPSLPASYEALIHNISKRDQTRAAITKAYLFELGQALDEAFRVLQPGGRMVIAIGNNLVSGTVVANDSFVEQRLEQLGAVTELAVSDSIKTRGLMRKRNSTASTIDSETVLVFRKASQ